MPYGVNIGGMRCSDLNADGTEVQTNKIFVGGLAMATTTEVLKGYFSKFGTVVDCTLKKDRSTGFGFVHFDGMVPVESVCNGGMHQVQGKWVEVRKAVPLNQCGPAVPVRNTTRAPPRAASPHGGSRAFRESLLAGGGAGRRKARSRSSDRKKGRRRKASSSSSKSSTAKRKGKRKRSASSSSNSSSKKRTRKKKAKIRSSSSSSSVEITAGASGAKAAAALRSEPEAANPDVAKAKAAILDRLVALKSVEPKEERMKEWRALLREWHPDKNPHRVEVATAVFQFLQKGKMLLEPD
mmetsp:Transcript_124556/g.278533  ORF Transcript_124556/g.278533 Transcript_124556/m.278533 type:complete len:296 (-) Transcript_124556:8-895(-)